MSNDTPLLELDQVHKHYPVLAGQTAPDVIAGVSFRILPGETVAVTGPSGCGKSTLLNLMGLLDTPTAGTVSLFGQNTAAMNENERADLRNRKIGFIFQFHHLLPQCTVLENVLLPILAHAGRSTEAEALRATALLESAGLADKAHRLPAQLSGGEQLRTAVVRALINQPSLLLADEPTGALDRQTAATIADLLLDLNQSHNLAFVVVTHSETLARRMQTQYRLLDGRLAKP